MASISQLQVETALKEVVDPYLEQDLVTAKCIKRIAVEADRVAVDVVLGYPAKGTLTALSDKLREKILRISGVKGAEVHIEIKIVSHGVQKGVKQIPGVKNVIAVASGKGGVGKSTTAVNLALALSAEGASVGILDADIYGPSQPRMLGTRAKPESKDGKTMEPVVSYHLQSMSIGYLIDEETPMIWRGPMVTQTLMQLLQGTLWSDLDYLIVDLPPGTGDIQLTLAQRVPVAGAIIVTTPQDIALIDAMKALKMFEKVAVPVLGIIENMATHVCSNCGHEEHIFGTGGGARLARDYGVPLLGAMPLDIRIREQMDAGTPAVVAMPGSDLAGRYRAIARSAAARLALQALNKSIGFPKIVVE